MASIEYVWDYPVFTSITNDGDYVTVVIDDAYGIRWDWISKKVGGSSWLTLDALIPGT